MAWKGIHYVDPATLTEIAPEEVDVFDLCPWKTVSYEGESYADEVDNEFEDIYVAESSGIPPDPS